MEAKIAGIVHLLAAGLILHACACSRFSRERPVGAVIEVTPPRGLPPLPVPRDNPVTAETIALGRRLFYDARVSVDNTVSCATCHNPLLGFADGRRVSTGVHGASGLRNAPSVLNAAYARLQFWDGRASSLEEQASVPISNPMEMNHTHDVFTAKLNADPASVSEFQKAFGPGRITIGKVEKALASFERTLLSGNSPFDRYQFGGVQAELTAAAVRGLAIFLEKGKGNCVTCHTIESSYALFSDGKFHNLGVGIDHAGELTDLGRFNHTKVEADKGAFKTPILRNVASTAPYMHDGNLKTLRQVVDFYTGGGNSNSYLDKEIKPLNLTGGERDDLVAFLESLTGQIPPDVGPPPKK